MKVTVVAVGSPSRLLADPIREYEQRASRYWKLETVDVDAEKASKNRPVEDVMGAEGERLVAAVPERTEIVALTRTGKGWGSRKLAKYLNRLAVTGGAGATFLIGGAHGLDTELVGRARHRLSLSDMTLPHDMARLLLAEQLYRAGTIVRGEPYHKG